MREKGLPELAILNFRRSYTKLLEGGSWYLRSDDISPIDGLLHIRELDEFETAGINLLDKLVVLRLAGGIGTTMGMKGPKFLLPVKHGYTFLDIAIEQILHTRKKYKKHIPIIFWTSFVTDKATLSVAGSYPELAKSAKLPLTFKQNMVPKVKADDFKPVRYEPNSALEWCPPGHGDLFVSLVTTGMLDELIEKGYEYMFVSNGDNMGARVEPRILGYIDSIKSPFLMEVVSRSKDDVKGGHLAKLSDGSIILRERVQAHPDDIDDFEDYKKYRYFNSNSIWIHLPSLKEKLSKNNNLLELPVFLNKKNVNPADLESQEVYQLETAVGSAIAAFGNATAINVDSDRFIPVKKTDDLLKVRSDAYELAEDFSMKLAVDNRTHNHPYITLDKRYFKLIEDFEKRMQDTPSLKRCDELEVLGNVYFGTDVTILGSSKIIGSEGEASYVEDGAELSGEIYL